jgi:hypothetical protein
MASGFTANQARQAENQKPPIFLGSIAPANG